MRRFPPPWTVELALNSRFRVHGCHRSDLSIKPGEKKLNPIRNFQYRLHDKAKAGILIPGLTLALRP